MKKMLPLFFAVAFFLPAKADVLDDVRARGYLSCGLYKDIPGLSLYNEGFEAELCRAVAGAILDNQNALEFSQLDSDLRFAALDEGVVDILFASTTWTMDREIRMKYDFPAIAFYEGQGILAMKASRITDLKDLKKGARICTIGETTLVPPLNDLIKSQPDKNLKLLTANTSEGLRRMLFKKECDLISEETIPLATMLENDEERKMTVRLQETIASQPLAAVIKPGERRLYGIVEWLLNALVLAEIRGVTVKNVDEIRARTTDREIRFMLGAAPGVGVALGVSDDWIYKIIKEKGNYGEMFENSAGKNSPFKIDRALSAPYKAGGLYYPKQFR